MSRTDAHQPWRLREGWEPWWRLYYCSCGWCRPGGRDYRRAERHAIQRELRIAATTQAAYREDLDPWPRFRRERG